MREVLWTIILLFVWCSVSQPIFPGYFILTTNRTHPNVPYSSSQVISYDSTMGLRADTTFVFLDNSIQEVTVLYPNSGNVKYTSIVQLFGEYSTNICFMEPISVLDVPPFRLPKFYANITNNGMVNGETVEVWYPIPDTDCCPPHWWYLYKTSFGKYYPYAWAGVDGDLNVVLDFSLQVPSPALFYTPECIPIRQPISHNKRDVTFTPMAPNWPDSFSMSLVLSTLNREIYVNGQTGSMATVVTQSSLPLLPNFQYSSILRNDINTLYTVTNWLNINPLPCILEINAPVTIWKKPMLTRLSSIELYGNNYAVYDVVGAGPQLEDIWFFNGSVPTAYYNAGGRLGGSISKVAMWNPMPPDNNIFNIPVNCLPRSNMDGKKEEHSICWSCIPCGIYHLYRRIRSSRFNGI